MNRIGWEQNHYGNYYAEEYTAAVRQWMTEDDSQPAAVQPADAEPGQAVYLGKQNNHLMETFEKMSNGNTQKREVRTIQDPFGLRRKQEAGPYASYANENGVIVYNGVEFQTRGDCICLGNMENLDQVVRIPLSAGGSVLVNRSCIGQLARAIGMFSPEDQGRILRALEQDAKIQQVKNEIEELKGQVGKKNDAGQDAGE